MISTHRALLAGLAVLAAVGLPAGQGGAEEPSASWDEVPALQVCRAYQDFLRENPGSYAPIYILKPAAAPTVDAATDACAMHFDVEMKLNGETVPVANYPLTVPVAEARSELEVTGVRPPAQGRPSHADGPGLDEIRTWLATKLGLAPAQLKPGTDLVGDLGLDRSVVFYALADLYEAFGVAPPAVELTVLREITAHLQAKARFRGPVADRARDSYVKTVYFATNRKRTGSAKPDRAFGGERAPDGRMSYGVAEVTIPFSHRLGQLESPWLRIRRLRDRRKHIFVLRLDRLEASDFFSVVGTAIGGEGGIVVYVHGFNVSFDDAVKRTAQIAFDFGFNGAPIVFSWPSDARLASYNADWEDALWSARHMERLLTSLKRQFPDRKVHVIAHSMGSKVLLHAMRLLAYGKARGPMFDSVMLCAPDFDAELFADQLAGEIASLSKQWVIYTSRKDIALMASETINAAARLGTPVTVAEGMEIIDASEVQVTPWSVPETHSYYATKKAVLDDMIGVLRGLLPAERGLRPVTAAAGTVWHLR